MNLRDYKKLHIPYILEAIEDKIAETLENIYTDRYCESYYINDGGIKNFNALLSARKLLKELQQELE